MSFIHVNNHPRAKTLFVACCKMSNKYLMVGYRHDKQITSRVWILTCLPVYDEDVDDDNHKFLKFHLRFLAIFHYFFFYEQQSCRSFYFRISLSHAQPPGFDHSRP